MAKKEKRRPRGRARTQGMGGASTETAVTRTIRDPATGEPIGVVGRDNPPRPGTNSVPLIEPGSMTLTPAPEPLSAIRAVSLADPMLSPVDAVAGGPPPPSVWVPPPRSASLPVEGTVAPDRVRSQPLPDPSVSRGASRAASTSAGSAASAQGGAASSALARIVTILERLGI